MQRILILTGTLALLFAPAFEARANALPQTKQIAGYEARGGHDSGRTSAGVYASRKHKHNGKHKHKHKKRNRQKEQTCFGLPATIDDHIGDIAGTDGDDVI